MTAVIKPPLSKITNFMNEKVMGRHSPGTPELPGRDGCLQVPRGLVYTVSSQPGLITLHRGMMYCM